MSPPPSPPLFPSTLVSLSMALLLSDEDVSPLVSSSSDSVSSFSPQSTFLLWGTNKKVLQIKSSWINEISTAPRPGGTKDAFSLDLSSSHLVALWLKVLETFTSIHGTGISFLLGEHTGINSWNRHFVPPGRSYRYQFMEQAFRSPEGRNRYQFMEQTFRFSWGNIQVSIQWNRHFRVHN